MTLHLEYRPHTFDQLVGQDFIKRCLVGALDAEKIAPAYLFTGARGTGKTSTARLFAKSLNCDEGVTSTPCGKCGSCRAIDTTGCSLAVSEIDAASNNGVDDARRLKEVVQFRPMGRYTVVVIDECHMLTTQAQNALLKTLEEPPKHVVFILATTEPHKVLDTIRSRCHEFRFNLVAAGKVVEQLDKVIAAEKIQIKPEAVETIAQATGGSIRDSLSVLGLLGALDDITVSDVYDAMSIVPPAKVYDVVHSVTQKDVKSVLQHLGTLSTTYEVSAVLDAITALYRDLLVSTTISIDFARCADVDVKEKLGTLDVSKDWVERSLSILFDSSSELKTISVAQHQVWLDVLGVKLSNV